MKKNMNLFALAIVLSLAFHSAANAQQGVYIKVKTLDASGRPNPASFYDPEAPYNMLSPKPFVNEYECLVYDTLTGAFIPSLSGKKVLAPTAEEAIKLCKIYIL